MLIGPIAAVLAAVLIGAAWDASGLEAEGSAARAAFGIVAALASAAAAGWLAGRFLRGRALALLQGGVAAAYALLVFGFGWKAFVGGLAWIEAIPTLRAVLEVAPAIAIDLLAARLALRAFPRGIEPPAAALRAPRPYLIPLVPYLAFSALLDLRHFFPALEEAIVLRESAAIALLLCCLSILLAFAPRLARLLFPAEPLPPGPLRDALLALADRARVRIREIYVWHTGKWRIANACIAGILARTRAVFLSDQLLAVLAPREIEAVFAHELGHARGHHFAWYFAYAIAFIVLLAWLDGFAPFEALAPAARFAFFILALVLWWRVLFGWISRRMELEADAIGIRLSGDPAALAGALQILGLSTGRTPSWRHLPIPRRIAFALSEGAAGWRSRAARAVVAISATLAAAAWIDVAVREARRPPWRSDLIVAELALDRASRGRMEEIARAIALAARALPAADPEGRERAFRILAAAYDAAGDPERAARARAQDSTLGEAAAGGSPPLSPP